MTEKKRDKTCSNCRWWTLWLAATSFDSVVGQCEIDMETKTCNDSCVRFEEAKP